MNLNQLTERNILNFFHRLHKLFHCENQIRYILLQSVLLGSGENSGQGISSLLVRLESWHCQLSNVVFFSKINYVFFINVCTLILDNNTVIVTHC